MRERPIIFTGESVRAILDGRKTQTRRVVKLSGPADCVHPRKDGRWEFSKLHGEDGELTDVLACPYGQPGDRLWVRETWCKPGYGDKRTKEVLPLGLVEFRADCGIPQHRLLSLFYLRERDFRWRSPIHMPRWVSRITLEVTSVRVEQLQDISERDIRAEGCPDFSNADERTGVKDTRYVAEYGWYSSAWDSINAKRGHSWESNPWVWVVEFMRP